MGRRRAVGEAWHEVRQRGRGALNRAPATEPAAVDSVQGSSGAVRSQSSGKNTSYAAFDGDASGAGSASSSSAPGGVSASRQPYARRWLAEYVDGCGHEIFEAAAGPRLHGASFHDALLGVWADSGVLLIGALLSCCVSMYLLDVWADSGALVIGESSPFAASTKLFTACV